MPETSSGQYALLLGRHYRIHDSGFLLLTAYKPQARTSEYIKQNIRTKV